ncbi:MAG TPA: sulfite exporter TauE/SafE family protein [Candidatus Binatia bacterium]
MLGPADMLLLGGGAFLAAMLAAVAGFGGAAVLLPPLVVLFGVRDAIPILTVAQLIGNLSRVWFNRRELDFRVAGWFALGGVPAAVAGGLLFASAPLSFLTRLLGVFLIAVVLYRHLGNEAMLRVPLRGFALLGAVFSFVSALLGSVGPIMIPFFLAYGLVKGALIGTEALATVVMHVTKLAVYGGTSVLTAAGAEIGLLLGGVMILGSFAGKRILDRVPEKIFLWLVEAALLIAGLNFLLRG